MTGKKLIQQTALYLKRHSPTILTCLGSIGVVATAVLTSKAAIKATELLAEAEIDKREDLTILETVAVAGPSYIPAVLMGTATIACIFGANALNARQQAALTSAYIFLNNAFENYKKKAIKLYSEDADKQIQSEIVREKSRQFTDLRVKSDNDILVFYEDHYGKFFERTMLEVQEAEYELNRKLAMEGEATLNDFFELLGLSEQDIGDALGWSQESICDYFNPPWIDFEHYLTELDDGLECYIINILTTPNANF